MARRRRSTGPAALPPDFVEQLRDLVPADEHAELVASFELPRQRGLRVNSRKASAAEVERLLGIPLTPVPWCADAYLLPEGQRGIGAHPAHLAGLFYLQEPSATLAVAAAGVQPGDRVVDLAASPGGKTLQLADAVGPRGLVIANEVTRPRLSPLHDNLDLWGAYRVLTTSTAVAALAAHPVWAEVADGEPMAGADVVLLDAPCSGEALFRRSERARREWSVNRVSGCAARQEGILEAGARLVRLGGRLVYATCTFNRQENEQRVQALLDTGGWTLLPVRLPGVSPGLAGLDLCGRVWPHRAAGEGQFVAVLGRTGISSSLPSEPPTQPGRSREARPGADGPPPDEVTAAWRAWAETSLTEGAQARLDIPAIVRGSRLFVPPVAVDAGAASACARAGVSAGELRPGRFEPAPALATFLTAGDVQAALELENDDPRLAAYLRGEEIADAGPDASVLVCLEGWGLGWARRRGGVLKNALPGWLRAMAAKGSAEA